MENNIVIVKNQHYKLVTNADIQLSEEIIVDYPNVVIITSFDINSLAKICLEKEKNVIHIYPSIAAMFCFNNSDILYLHISENEDEFVCVIEIVLDKKYIKHKAKSINGTLEYIVNELCLLLDVCKDVLCENIYVDGRSDLKKNMEERIMMEFGKGINVKYMKFLKVTKEIQNSVYCHEKIVDDAVSIGGLIASEVFFNRKGEYMSIEEYKNGDYSKLSPFD